PGLLPGMRLASLHHLRGRGSENLRHSDRNGAAARPVGSPPPDMAWLQDEMATGIRGYTHRRRPALTASLRLPPHAAEAALCGTARRAAVPLQLARRRPLRRIPAP